LADDFELPGPHSQCLSAMTPEPGIKNDANHHKIELEQQQQISIEGGGVMADFQWDNHQSGSQQQDAEE